MLSPFTGIGNRGGHPANDTPPPPNAPDFTDVPADALGHPRNPSSAESNTGGITASTNVQTATPAAAAIGGALPDFSDIVAACLAHVIFLIQALGLAGGDPGKEDVFQLVKKILEHLAISELDEDSECLIEFMPVEEDRTALIEDISAALAIEGASTAGIVNQLIDLVASPTAGACAAAPASAPEAAPLSLPPSPPSLPAPSPSGPSPPSGPPPTPGVPVTPPVVPPGGTAPPASPLSFSGAQFAQLLSALTVTAPAGSGSADKFQKAAEDGRTLLLTLMPVWFCSPPANFVAGTIALPSWKDTVLGAPVSKHETQTHLGPAALKSLLSSSYSNTSRRGTGAWTTCRASFISALAQLYVSACILSMVAGNAFADAARVAEARALNMHRVKKHRWADPSTYHLGNQCPHCLEYRTHRQIHVSR